MLTTVNKCWVYPNITVMWQGRLRISLETFLDVTMSLQFTVLVNIFLLQCSVSLALLQVQLVFVTVTVIYCYSYSFCYSYSHLGFVTVAVLIFVSVTVECSGRLMFPQPQLLGTQFFPLPSSLCIVTVS